MLLGPQIREVSFNYESSHCTLNRRSNFIPAYYMGRKETQYFCGFVKANQHINFFFFFFALPCRYQEAAVLFSQTQLSFEEVALKFIQANRTDALKLFLRKTLQSLPEKVGHVSYTCTCTCYDVLCTILMYMYVYGLNLMCSRWQIYVHVHTFMFIRIICVHVRT